MITETRNKSCKYMTVAAVVAVVKKFRIVNTQTKQEKEKQRKPESQNI